MKEHLLLCVVINILFHTVSHTAEEILLVWLCIIIILVIATGSMMEYNHTMEE